MKLFTHRFTDSKIAKFRYKKLSYKVIMFSLLSFISFIADAQTGVFSWYNGSVGQTWAATDVSKSYTISCGTGCTVTVTMTIIDPNNRNSSPTTYNYNPFDSGNGCLPYPGVAQTDNVTGNGSILDPWDSDCAPFYTQTGGAYGTNFLTFAMNSATHLEDVTIRYTFSKPVFLDAFTVGDIDGRTMQQDRDANQSGSLSVYELPGNSYQDEVTVSALGPNGSVGVNYSALGTLLFQTGQTVRSVYNANTTNLNPDDARGTITVNTNDAITQLDITYSNGPDDAAAEQANPTWYSWWVNGGTFTLSDGRVVTQPAKGVTNGVSDNHAIRISGFTFTACPDFDFTRTNATVCAGETATIGVVPANGTSPYTYSWNGPNGYTSSAQNPSITNITAAQAGIYTVTAYDANGCTGTTTAQITVNELPIAGITGTTNLSCTTVSVERTAVGGGTYLWSNGLGTSATVNITSAGTYTVTVTNSNGCSAIATTEVTLNNTPPIAGITGTTNLSCTTLSVERTATGGGTYLWSNSLGTSATVNITSAGTYTITVTDPANGCTSTATTEVTLNNTPPVAGITGTTNLSCTTLSVERTATGGGTYLWSNGLGTNATVNITSAGTYTVTVTNSNGCSAIATTAVTLNNTPPVAGITGTTNLSCTTLSVERTATGGGTYLWSNGLGTSATVNITSAGTYTVTVTDPANGCTSTATTEVTIDTTVPTPSINGSTNLTCTTTSVERTATGGGTYLWSNGLGTSATVNITSAGTYTVTVTNSNGCSAIATTAVTLNNTPPVAGITGTTNLSCTTLNVERTATGGGTYLWSNSLGTSETVNITSAGTYTVTVTDPANGCASTATTVVTLNNTPPVAGITGTTNLSCTTLNVERTATGGGTYLWSNSLGTSATVNITSAGTYTVTVTDLANGCTSTATTAVTIDTTVPTPSINGSTNLTCTTLSVERTAVGGGTYLWSNGLGTSATVNITSAGTYTVTVTNLNGCASTATTVVTLNNTPPVAGITGTTNLSCTTLSVERTATGSGTYLWSNGLGTSATVNITSAGTYTVTVTDPANGCISTATTAVITNNTPPIAGVIGTDNLSCSGGLANRVATGGGTYLWNGPNSYTSTSASIVLSLPGTYTVTVTDPANGCTATATTTVIIEPCGSIGDYVWSDTDTDGQQDSGEPVISGVKVYLLNASGVKLDSTLTDGSGKYLFDSLLSGSYRVQFVAPSGTIASKSNRGSDVTDSDANASGLSHLIGIDTSKPEGDSLRNNLNIDAGFVPVGSIGDYVFADNNGDGIQNTGDSPVAGMKVYLLDATTGAKLDSMLTDSNGIYKFDSLLTGNYKVKFVVPVGSEPTLKTVGGDVTKDSNVNPDGTTDAININTSLPIGDAGRNNTTVDAGIKPSYGSIGDYVWSDTDTDGQQDSGEPVISRVKVYLLNASGVKLDSTLTDGSGKYLFDSLLSGSYRVQFVAPSGTIASKSNRGSDVTDSDANASGLSHLIGIDTSKPEGDSLRNNLNIDAGFVPVGSIGNYVFQDKDNSGTRTVGDLPVSGVKVYLLDATTGAKLDSTITNSNGLYKFDSLISGNYKIQVKVPTSMSPVTKDSGSDDSKDSDIDPTGTTEIVTIDTTKPFGDPLRDNTSTDAGVKITTVDCKPTACIPYVVRKIKSK